MSSTQRLEAHGAARSWAQRSLVWRALGLSASLLAALTAACQGEPADLRPPVEEEAAPPPAAPAEHPPAAVVDLGSDEGPRQPLEGFSLPERVGPRFASWSEGELSTLKVDLRGGARGYLVAFLAEPYHRLADVAITLSLNGHSLGTTRLARGWRAYQLPVSGERVSAGRNTLALHYSKTARPIDLDPRSTDVRALSVRFDQIQIAPITERVQLGFGSKNALALAALGEGWARDPSDRGTGTWTVAERATLTFHLDASALRAGGPDYRMALTARAPRGVAERKVALTLGGAPLGSFAFSATKSTVSIDVPRDRLQAANELGFEFMKLESPAQLDAESKDQRLLGLRVFELSVAPRDPAASAAPGAPASGAAPGPEAPAVEAAALAPAASR